MTRKCSPEGVVAAEEVEVGGGRPAVQQHDDRRPGRPGEVAHHHRARRRSRPTRHGGSGRRRRCRERLLRGLAQLAATSSTRDPQLAALGRLVGDRVADPGAEQGGPERGRGADHVEARGPLLDVADEVALGVVVAVALVHDGDDRARARPRPARAPR